MISPDKFLTVSLSRSPIGMQICKILATSIDAVDPYTAVKKHLKLDNNTLLIEHQVIKLSEYKRVIIISIGKASVPMANAVYDILSGFRIEGIIITKEGYLERNAGHLYPQNFQIIQAGHPIPNENSLLGANKIIKLLETTTQQDLILLLISGGGSSLMTSPIEEVSINDIKLITSLLINCGATIQEINCVRKHLDRIKGGQLAHLAAPSTLISLIISDVIGDELDAIASGPTVPDSTTYKDALSILKKYNLFNKSPLSIVSHLTAGADYIFPETPKAQDPIFQNIHNYIIGNNRQAAEAAVKQAQTEGFHTTLLTNYLQGEARYVGKVVASLARQAALHGEPVNRPGCIILGGETTVSVIGQGAGGRNQELALSTVDMIAGLKDLVVVTLATDGGDGMTDAAGAVVTGETYARAKAQGMYTNNYLIDNNSYNFFLPLSDLIMTGPTETNVNDLCMVFSF